MRLDEYFPRERLAGMRAHLQQLAERNSIEGFRQPERIPNTRRALALAEVARDEDRLDAYRQRAMDAHWRDGLNLESDEDLRLIASDAGLSADAVARSTEDPRYLERVDAMRAEANDVGVQGIPTFVLGPYALSGAQPYEVFEELARRAGAAARGRPAR
jgi:predicted DsbA family dithiol-disulfide isomerase